MKKSAQKAAMRYSILCLILLSGCDDYPKDYCYLIHEESKGYVMKCKHADGNDYDLQVNKLCPKVRHDLINLEE